MMIERAAAKDDVVDAREMYVVCKAQNPYPRLK